MMVRNIMEEMRNKMKEELRSDMEEYEDIDK